MTNSRTPPFHAEHLGSLLRPKELTQASRAHAGGEIDDAAFGKIQEDAIRRVVALQEDAGLEVVTDGEYRRASYWGHWVDAIEGLGTARSLFTFHDEGGEEPALAFAAGVDLGSIGAGDLHRSEHAYLIRHPRHPSRDVSSTVNRPLAVRVRSL